MTQWSATRITPARKAWTWVATTSPVWGSVLTIGLAMIRPGLGWIGLALMVPAGFGLLGVVSRQVESAAMRSIATLVLGGALFFWIVILAWVVADATNTGALRW